MNDNLITAQLEADEKEIVSLRSRLSEVEKRLIEAHALIAKLSHNEACKPSKLGA